MSDRNFGIGISDFGFCEFEVEFRDSEFVTPSGFVLISSSPKSQNPTSEIPIPKSVPLFLPDLVESLHHLINKPVRR